MAQPNHPLSFGEMAKYVAAKPPEDRERACKNIERSLAWDWRKLLTEANRLASEEA